jgi:primosomal protein N' (replication factor Y)
MPRRVFNRPLPAVRTIDLRDESHGKLWRGAISRPLCQAMEAALRDDGQVILLLNRRGFSTHIQCPGCGHVEKCPHCDLPLTFHRHQSTAICHYCDYQIPVPTACPDCKSPGMRFSGLGTQKLEAEVRARFPQYACLRMDTDSMHERGSHERALASFRDGAVRILLGTQMIAKGLDFPNVTLVGVINADTALNLPDFRASERTFQLVTQVAGRTGRGAQGGRVLVQTFAPETPAILAAVRHDYGAFARSELPHREAAGYPPFASMARIVVRGESEANTRALSDEIGKRLRAKGADGVRVLGPAPAPMTKLRGQYRYQIQLQAVESEPLRIVIRAATSDLKLPEGLVWTVDVDPWDMM